MRACIGISGGALLTFLLIGGAGCSPDSPLPAMLDPTGVNCSTVSASYENFAAGFFQRYCIRCHSVSLSDDLSRTDAPMGINFDTLDMAREFKKRIRLRAGMLGDMPPHLLPGPQPTMEERVELIKWLDCGMESESAQAGS